MRSSRHRSSPHAHSWSASSTSQHRSRSCPRSTFHVRGEIPPDLLSILSRPDPSRPPRSSPTIRSTLRPLSTMPSPLPSLGGARSRSAHARVRSAPRPSATLSMSTSSTSMTSSAAPTTSGLFSTISKCQDRGASYLTLSPRRSIVATEPPSRKPTIAVVTTVPATHETPPLSLVAPPSFSSSSTTTHIVHPDPHLLPSSPPSFSFSAISLPLPPSATAVSTMSTGASPAVASLSPAGSSLDPRRPRHRSRRSAADLALSEKKDSPPLPSSHTPPPPPRAPPLPSLLPPPDSRTSPHSSSYIAPGPLHDSLPSGFPTVSSTLSSSTTTTVPSGIIDPPRSQDKRDNPEFEGDSMEPSHHPVWVSNFVTPDDPVGRRIIGCGRKRRGPDPPFASGTGSYSLPGWGGGAGGGGGGCGGGGPCLPLCLGWTVRGGPGTDPIDWFIWNRHGTDSSTTLDPVAVESIWVRVRFLSTSSLSAASSSSSSSSSSSTTAFVKGCPEIALYSRPIQSMSSSTVVVDRHPRDDEDEETEEEKEGDAVPGIYRSAAFYKTRPYDTDFRSGQTVLLFAGLDPLDLHCNIRHYRLEPTTFHSRSTTRCAFDSLDRLFQIVFQVDGDSRVDMIVYEMGLQIQGKRHVNLLAQTNLLISPAHASTRILSIPTRSLAHPVPVPTPPSAL